MSARHPRGAKREQSFEQHFPIYPVDRFAKLNAIVKRPREFSYFSYDEEHIYKQDASSMRYFYQPTLPSNLNTGFDTFRNLDDSKDEHLDSLLQSIIYHEQQTKAKLETEFITWRGMMTKIMTCPYANFDAWEMNITKFQGTVFIEENHQAKLDSRDEQYQQVPVPGHMSQDLMSYWGYKFESLCLLDKHWCSTDRATIEGRENAPVSNYAQYCSIVRTGFGSSKVVLAGEVDAVMDNKPPEPGAVVNWVELKTTAEITDDKSLNKYERKLMKFWAQSFLLGVPKVIVGFRDQQGWLLRLKELETQKIPEMMAKTGRRLWDAQGCINFTTALLDFLKEHVTDEGVYRLTKKSKGSSLVLTKIEETGTGSILSNPFITWRNDILPRIVAAEQEAISRTDEQINSHQQGADQQPNQPQPLGEPQPM